MRDAAVITPPWFVCTVTSVVVYYNLLFPSLSVIKMSVKGLEGAVLGGLTTSEITKAKRLPAADPSSSATEKVRDALIVLISLVQVTVITS
jgi:hypothetical protein